MEVKKGIIRRGGQSRSFCELFRKGYITFVHTLLFGFFITECTNEYSSDPYASTSSGVYT